MKDINNVPTKKLKKILLYKELVLSFDDAEKMSRQEIIALLKANKVKVS